MANQILDGKVLSIFCESVATMLSAGITTEESVHMLAEGMEDPVFRGACESVYRELIKGKSLSASLAASGAFPDETVSMVDVGERAGRLEETLRSLGVYYDEEDRLFSKIRSSVGYPASLLCVMSVILAFTVAVILPVFVDVYENLSGSLTAGSFNAVGISIAIGWVALAVTLVCAVVCVAAVFACRTDRGRLAIVRALEAMPFSRAAMGQLALSRFMSALATYTTSGVTSNEAVKGSLATVTNKKLRVKVDAIYEMMIDPNEPRSLSQAIDESRLLDSVYARMLSVGTRSGSLDASLGRLSRLFFEDAVDQIDRMIDNVEPIIAAFLTIAVGTTLIAVMLPLIGIMGSIG